MAQASLPTLLSVYGGPFLFVLAAILVLRLILKYLVIPKVFPIILNRFTAKYNAIMENFKQELLQKDLQTLVPKPSDEGGTKPPTAVALNILEIGVGTGANFKYYPDGTSVVAIEPNKNFLGYLEKNVAVHSPRVRLRRTVIAFAEDLRGHVEDSSVDAVVSTLVLCSVRDVDAVMGEAKRVLKPGGKFYFLEHVAADPGTWRRTFQWILQKPWAFFGDGCQLMRTPWKNVDRAGFSKVHYKRFLAPSKKFTVVQPHVMGTATK